MQKWEVKLVIHITTTQTIKGFSMEEIAFQEGDTRSVEQITKKEMEGPIKHFEKELVSIRTGRASVSLLDNIVVECYGQMMPLRELATISAPESRLLTIQPWDKSQIGPIEKAIKISDLGIAPINDGTIIRLQLPQMSMERRDELTKVLGKKVEEARIGIRNVRRDVFNEIREAQKKHIISEDFAHRLSDHLQKVTDDHIAKVETMYKKKSEELHTI